MESMGMSLTATRMKTTQLLRLKLLVAGTNTSETTLERLPSLGSRKNFKKGVITKRTNDSQCHRRQGTWLKPKSIHVNLSKKMYLSQVKPSTTRLHI